MIDFHEIGPYQIVEYHPPVYSGNAATKKIDMETVSFHLYLDGCDASAGFHSLDAALAGGIAHRALGPNCHAAKYFIAALEALAKDKP